MVYLQRQRNPPQQEKFIQILKTWEILGIFHANTLREIRQTLNFNTWVEETETRCITPEYLAKIDNLRRTLNPIYLPIEMAYQNKFKFGSDLNQIELRTKLLTEFRNYDHLWFDHQMRYWSEWCA